MVGVRNQVKGVKVDVESSKDIKVKKVTTVRNDSKVVN